MYAQPHYYDYSAAVTDIHSWLDDCIAQHPLVPLIMDDDIFIEGPVLAEEVFSTPTKKRQLSQDGDDVDDTPRPSLGLQSQQLEAPRYVYSQSASTSSASRSSGRTSGRSSPTKKELHLRQAIDFPVKRILLSKPSITPAGLPPAVRELMAELTALGAGRKAVIPESFHGRMCSENEFLNQPDDRWFDQPAEDTDESRFRDLYRDGRLRSLWRRSLRCTERREHEAGWNDNVHGPLLYEALDDISNVAPRNITTSRITLGFQDPDPALGGTKVDYGVFLESARLDDLGKTLGPRLPLVHVDLSDLSRTPLLISVETKSSNAREADGPTQLANWARAHFRHLEHVARPAAKRAMSDVPVGNPVGQAAVTVVRDGAPRSLPVLPLVFVFGDRWSVSFAQRTETHTLIWQDISLGSTNTLQGCYFVFHSLRRLATWAATELGSWWEDMLMARLAEQSAR
ncbi:hypothetical protein CONLIGDRAFT_636923 [Coniochaeta ligniaria NRRL 30616]|uniref:PD-(D/E)XK nuclease-like domain-containing protein n=1 Tax=Coniochaeta ligniaria NRRL 30616 TaxID=1408157 RepID=A0A1J7I9Y5_9PEZI|nr:hypothetical protein CONLIGDRAFT_636923 [Coniochaeta ligniaria NRRL 30616]